MIDSSRRIPPGSLDGALSRCLLEQIGAGALLYAFALPALCFILWPVVPTQYLIPWAIILALTAIARTAIARTARTPIETANVLGLRGRASVVLIISSVTWGAAAGFLLAIPSPTYQMFVGVALAGVASATVLSITSAPTVTRACVVLILLPLVVVSLAANPTSYTFAPFIAIWGGVLVVLAKRLHNSLCASLTLEITNLQLLDELKAQSASLEQSEAYFRTLAERAQDIVLTLSENGVIKYCSPSVEPLLGYRVDDLVGTRLCDYAHGNDIAALDRVLSNAGNADSTREPLVARLRSRDGESHHIELSIRDLTDDPVISGIVINARDVTLRRKAEAELTSANDRFNIAFQSNPAAVAIAAADSGILRSVNDKWTELFGYGREEAIGRTGVELGIWRDPAERTRALEARSPDGSLSNFDVTFKARDGSVIHGLHSAEAIEVDGQTMRLGMTIDVTERKLAEEGLRRANDRFHTAFHSSPNLIGLTEIDSGRVVDVNEKWLSTLGYRREEIIGRVVEDLGVWSNFDERRTLIAQVQASGSVRDLETTFRKRDGVLVHALFGAVLTEVEGRKLLLWVGTDVTERKEAQDALRRSEEKFRNLVQGSVQGLVVMNQAWKPVFANQAAAHIFGFDNIDELLEIDSIEPGVHRADLARLQAFTRARFEGDPTVPAIYEYRGFRKDGTMIWLQVMVQVIDWQGERCLQCTQIDISEQKAAEQDARDSDTRFRNLIEGSIEGIMVFGKDRLLFVNQALADIFGYSIEELLSEVTIDDLIDPAEHERLRLYRDNRLHSEDVPDRYEFRGRRKNGASAWLEISVHLVTWKGEQAYQCSTVDRTARREAEDQLRQSLKLEAIGGLTGGIAHEFNNLLMVVTGNLELLRDRLEDETEKKWVATALKGATRGAELTQRLLSFARRQPLRPQATDVNELVDGALQMSEKTLGSQIDLAVEKHPGPGPQT